MADSRSNRKDTHENLDLPAAADVTLRRRPAARPRPRTFLFAAFSQCNRRSKKEPRQTSCRGSRIHTSIKRSGQEVAVSANGERPSRGIGFVPNPAAEGVGGEAGRRAARTSDDARSSLCAVQVLVYGFHAQVERLGHVPLSAGADAPGLPVVVAARVSNRQ